MGECDFCGGVGQVPYEDPATRRPATMLCPQCTPASVDLDPQVEDEYEYDDYAGDLAYGGELVMEPIVITVKRYKCPHCNRSRSAKKATLEHMGRCWQNPAARGCRTCANYEPANDACGCEPGCNWGNGGESIPEHCRAGVDLTVRPCPTCEGSSRDGDFVDCKECGNTGVDKATSQPIVHCEKWEPAHA